MGKDRNPDGVSTHPADENDLASYERAGDALSRLSTPVLLDSSRPNVPIGPTPPDPDAPMQAAASAHARDAHSRLDGLLAGRIDPGVQEAWDREVAARAVELLPGIARGPAPPPQQATPQPELVH